MLRWQARGIGKMVFLWSFQIQSNTRPDVAEDSDLLVQETKESLHVIHTKQLNTATNRVKKGTQLCVKVDKLELEILRILEFADASFANASNYHMHCNWQWCFKISLSDKRNRIKWQLYRFYKCKMFVRSVLAGEIKAFMDAFFVSFRTSLYPPRSVHDDRTKEPAQPYNQLRVFIQGFGPVKQCNLKKFDDRSPGFT